MSFSEIYTIFFYIASFIFYTSSKCGRSLCPTLYNRYVDFVAGTVAGTSWELAQTVRRIIKISQVIKTLFSR